MENTTPHRPVLAKAGQGARALCKRTWWVFLVGGIAAVIFGILAFMQPASALLVLAIYFAAMVLVDGAVNAWGAITNRDKDGWVIMLLLGVIGVVAGGYALLHPALSVAAFILVVAFTAILFGVLLLSLGFKIRKESEREWILYLNGALSVLFGILIVARPAEGSVTIIYLIAFWAILLGALKIWFAFKVKNLPDAVGERIADRA
jgi:uncharacterized membrane protein HdeD (DUF308 family)